MVMPQCSLDHHTLVFTVCVVPRILVHTVKYTITIHDLIRKCKRIHKKCCVSVNCRCNSHWPYKVINAKEKRFTYFLCIILLIIPLPVHVCAKLRGL